MARLCIIILCLALGAGAAVAHGQSGGEMMTKPGGNILEADPADHSVCTPGGIAVGGYDLLSYRDDGGPILGEETITAEHDGLVYRFVSEANRDAFTDDPRRYLPRYGGWCAVTLALGSLNCPDYTNFQIEDGELLLFETTGFTNGRVLWNTDAPGYRNKADDNYRRLLEAE